MSLQRLFQDSKGRVILWQKPNLPIIGWLIFFIASWFADSDNLKTGLSSLSQAFLFVWAYLELTIGVTLFRRILGGAVLIYIIYKLVT